MHKNKLEFLVMLDAYYKDCVSPVDTGQSLEVLKEQLLQDDGDYIIQNDYSLLRIWDNHGGKIIKRFGTAMAAYTAAYTTKMYTLADIQNMLPGIEIKKI